MIVQIIYLISSPCHCLIWSLKTNLFQKCPKSLNKNILHRRWFLLQWYKWMSDYGQWRLQPQSSSSMLQYPWRPNLRSMPCWIPGKGVRFKNVFGLFCASRKKLWNLKIYFSAQTDAWKNSNFHIFFMEEQNNPYTYSHLSNKRTGWNKRVWRAEFFV